MTWAIAREGEGGDRFVFVAVAFVFEEEGERDVGEEAAGEGESPA